MKKYKLQHTPGMMELLPVGSGMVELLLVRSGMLELLPVGSGMVELLLVGLGMLELDWSARVKGRKEAALRNFHQLRISELPDIWN